MESRLFGLARKGNQVRLGIWANSYDCPYLPEWQKGIDMQSDRDFMVYSEVEEAVKWNDCVLCLDIDDIPEPRLVWRAKLQAQRYDITGFGMTMFGEIEGVFGKTVNINDYNVWGFGNTVWRSEVLAGVLPLDMEAEQPDYEAVKRAVAGGASLHFDEARLIRYRQYGQDSRLCLGKDGCYVWTVD